MKYFGFGLLFSSVLWANPTAPVVMEGAGSFSESGQLLEITAADKTILHWDQFSITAGETTRFIQPSEQSVVLNRVMGSFPSFIDGRLEANGCVVLVNPNGMILGPNGVISTADFIASTYDIFDMKDGSIQERRNEASYSGAINLDGVVRAAGFAEQGGRIILVAEAVNIGKEAFLSVDGKENGNAGEVRIWANGRTHFEGTISAQGGPKGGDGGFVEVSGNLLNFNGFVDRRAPLGNPGTLLLDPINITISAAADSANIINPAGPGTYTFSACAPTPANIDASVGVNSLNNNLNAGPVVINTSAAGGAGCPDLGNITVASPVNWTASNSLTLIADNNITILADIDCTVAGPISITAGGSLTIGSIANATPAIVQTQGQIDVLAGTGMSVIAGLIGGDAAIQSTLNTAPLNITVTSGDLLISASTSSADATVGSSVSGGYATIIISNGSLLVENNNDGTSTIGTTDALTIFASQNIQFTSNGNATSDIQCLSITGNPSTVTSGIDSTFNAFPFSGNYDTNFTAPLTWNVGRDMNWLSTSTGDVSAIVSDTVFNIGRNFYLSSMGGGNVSVISNSNLTMNVSGDFTIQNQSAFQSVVFASGALDLHIAGDVLVENLGSTTMLSAVIGGVLSVSIDAGGSVILGNEGEIRSFGGPITVIANQNISMGINSAIDGFMGSPTSITLVVDNQAPTAPAIGTGAFTMHPTAVINSGGVIPVQIFTARQSQNSILGLINNSPFAPGTFSVDTPTEHWNVYYPDSFIGPLYTIFYKDGFPSAPAVLTTILNVSTQSIAVTFDMLQEFEAPIPYYADHFCFTYEGEEQASMSGRNQPLFETKQCPWILVENYRKYHPALSRWGYAQTNMVTP